MSTQLDSTLRVPRVRRYLVFRCLAAGIFALIVVGIANWRKLLTPWEPLADPGGHGWVRTPELHLFSDSASAAIMTTIAVGALLTALRPTNRTAPATWTAIMLIAIGGAALVSAALQGIDLLSTLLSSLVLIAVVVVPYVLLHPEHAGLKQLRAGAPAAAGPTDPSPTDPGPIDPGPTPGVRAGLAILGSAGLVLAVGMAGWRLTGHVFENPLEDDIIGFTLLGLGLALGCFLARGQRTGWRALAWLMTALSLYTVAAAVTITLN